MKTSSLSFFFSRSRSFCAVAGVAAVALLMVAPAGGQDWAKTALEKSSRHGEYVVIPEANGRKLQAFVVYPEVKGKAPVVVLIHEIFGQSDWMRLMGDELAAKGYIVVVPDLLSGFGAPAAGMAASMPGMDMTDHTHPAPSGGWWLRAERRMCLRSRAGLQRFRTRGRSRRRCPL